MKKTIFLSFCIHLMLFPISVFALNGSAPDRSFIFTQGDAEIKGRNDSARLSAAVRTSGTDMEKTASENAGKTRAVIEAIKSLKIPHMTLKTVNYRLTPQRDFKKKPPKILGYEVYNEIEITVEGFAPEELSAHVSHIFGQALESGANDIQDVRFYIRNKKTLEEEGLKQAAREAMDRAVVLAEACGVKLRRIASISMGPIPVPAQSQTYRMAEMKADSGSMEPPVEVGKSTIRAHVSISYEIE